MAHKLWECSDRIFNSRCYSLSSMLYLRRTDEKKSYKFLKTRLEHHVSDNTRSRIINRFVSSKMQWLCVILVKIFRFPQLVQWVLKKKNDFLIKWKLFFYSSQKDLRPSLQCHFHYMKKLEHICINTNHYELLQQQPDNLLQQFRFVISSN